MKPSNGLDAVFRAPNHHQQLSAGRPVQVYTYVFGGPRILRVSDWCGAVHVFEGASNLVPHDHEHHELAIVVSGSAIHRTSGGARRVERGTVLAVGPRDVHAYEEADGLRMVNCTYLTEYLFYDVREILSVEGLAPLFFHESIAGGGLRLRVPQWRIHEEVLERCLGELRDIASERARPDASAVFMRRSLEKLMLILHRSCLESGEDICIPADLEVRTAIERIEEAITANLRFDAARLAREMGRSRDQFARWFRVSTGKTPTGYYQHRRVQQACRLLLDGSRDVTGVAHELGYYDAAHFSRLFKQYRGIGPKAFQKRYADTGQSGAVDDHNGCAEHGTGFM